ncbi:PspC domain-containing protein [Actinomadura sp. NEAU-AAG7]|uniref:PspC domain-containing protein n=1 Tax=Actinomadura sp. NEAU-AAG7 TaxID=2839640 RepID=UPI001BE3E911|nr:PspC domain-containing protein [Actinomadura sp. NEAU-AAG7]MBT2207795.1 PspC domain-containing protein [Actinomadura sp. NEAU-AAG7]
MDFEKSTTTTGKQLRRTRDGRMIAGVCSGAARFLGVDANLARLGIAVFTLFGGAGIALYVIGWVLIPEEGAPTSIAEDLLKKASDSPTVQDAVTKTKDAVNKNRSHT